MLDVPTEGILYPILLVLKILPDGLLDVLDLVLELYLFFKVLVRLFLDHSAVLASLLLQGRLLFVVSLAGLEFFSDELHVVLLEVDHLLEVLKEVVQRSEVLLVPGLVLGAQLQDDLEALLLKQALAELSDDFLLLLHQVLEYFALLAALFLLLLMQVFLGEGFFDSQLLIDVSKSLVLVDDLVELLLLFLNVVLDVI